MSGAPGTIARPMLGELIADLEAASHRCAHALDPGSRDRTAELALSDAVDALLEGVYESGLAQFRDPHLACPWDEDVPS